MGNRGILHNDQRVIIRDWQVRRWIACRLQFRGRHRFVMQPGSYTELFFLDEAAALAEGHRPCAECRHADFRAFQAAWRVIYPNPSATADAIDSLPRDIGVLIIDHDMDLVFRFAERITVMVSGAVFATGSPREIGADENVRAVYLGRAGHG